MRATTRFGAVTPLHLAAERGSGPIVSLLIKGGADVDARTGTGATALMFAAASGDVAAVKALIDGGADIEAKERDREHPQGVEPEAHQEARDEERSCDLGAPEAAGGGEQAADLRPDDPRIPGTRGEDEDSFPRGPAECPNRGLRGRSWA